MLRTDQTWSLPPDRRARLLRITLSLACLSGLLLSPKLWLSSRSFPLSPVSAKLPLVPPPFDYILFISLLTLLVLIAVAKRPFKFVVLFLPLAAILCLLDQSRLQPWFYQYVFMLAAFGFCLRNESDAESQKALLNTCRLIVVTMYFWSGLQKVSISFVDRVFPTLVNPYLNFIFGKVNLFPRPLILLIPLLEVGISIGLLTRKFRNVAVVLAVSMHMLILLLLIPIRVNSVVWPWNLAMIGFAVVLFWVARDFSMRELLLPRKLSFQLIVLVLFGLMPLLNFFNLWDSYLSAVLYSGNLPVAVVHVSEAARNRMPPEIQHQVERNASTGKLFINPNRWSLAELNVPDYRERRVFINLAKQICAYAESPAEVSLTIYGKPNRWNGSREANTFTCPDL